MATEDLLVPIRGNAPGYLLWLEEERTWIICLFINGCQHFGHIVMDLKIELLDKEVWEITRRTKLKMDLKYEDVEVSYGYWVKTLL